MDRTNLIQLNRRIGMMMGHSHGPKNLELIDDIIQAELMEALVLFGPTERGQPFRDCNRRTGYEMARYLLLQAGIKIVANPEELHELTMAWPVMNENDWAKWMNEHTMNDVPFNGTFDDFLDSLETERERLEAME